MFDYVVVNFLEPGEGLSCKFLRKGGTFFNWFFSNTVRNIVTAFDGWLNISVVCLA